MKQKTIRLFWWNEIKLMGKSKENYGDLLGKYLVEKISGNPVVWAHPKKRSLKNLFSPIYVTIGSILAQVSTNCVVWGSGVISKDTQVKRATFLAVRGPKTREVLQKLGYTVPEVYGDPALLLPKYYTPKIEKKYPIGIIPHYKDFELATQLYASHKNVLVIDLMSNDIEATTDSILQCERIVSSSLHGVIVSHAYQIPAVWVPFSDALFGDGIKYQDYFESVGLKSYVSKVSNTALSEAEIGALFTTYPILPDPLKIKELQDGLLKASPF